MIDGNKQVSQFVLSLSKTDLTWYINFNENQSKSKNVIKQNFLTFFRMKDTRHITTQKLKETKHLLGESVREYNKCFKYLLSKINYTIDKQLLVQWFMAGLLQKI